VNRVSRLFRSSKQFFSLGSPARVTQSPPERHHALQSELPELAQKKGVSRTATELRLEWSELKLRMTVTVEASQPKAPLAFVELLALRAQSVSECTIELGGRRCKLRIHLKGASMIGDN